LIYIVFSGELSTLLRQGQDYKGKNKKTQQQRFSILYIWAYISLHNESVSEEHLTKAAQINGIYDKNYHSYLREATGRSFVKLDGAFKLTPGGQSEVAQIQQDMRDSESIGSDYWNSNRKKPHRSHRVTKEDSQKVEEWIQMSSKLSEFDVRDLEKRYELAIFAIYDITKELKAETAVKPALIHEYLTKRYRTVSITTKQLSDVLSGKGYKKYFERTVEGSYYLTKEAESIGKNWIGKDSIET
jgi:hypothetical protein